MNPINSISEAINAADPMNYFPQKHPWSLTDPNPIKDAVWSGKWAKPMSGEAMAAQAGEEQSSAVMGLCDALRALARRIEDEGVSHHTVDQLQALKDEAEDLLP